MPTTDTYTYYYVITGTPGGQMVITSTEVGPIILSDTLDGTADGQTAIGDTLNWNSGPFNFEVTLAGFITNGGPTDPITDPIILFEGVYYLQSDTIYNVNDIFWTSTSGTYLYCFAADTLIATETGETRVADLSIGTPILTATGGTVRVKWIGRQTVSTRFGPAERLMPVRFAAGSLGEDVPSADLTVTADHGMLVDGVICHAGALVNGTTITRVPLAEMGETYVVYHIETEAHEIILANGASAETFIDNVSRRVFDNYAEFEALYGDVPEMAELPYPRAMSARQVPERIRAKLVGAAAA